VGERERFFGTLKSAISTALVPTMSVHAQLQWFRNYYHVRPHQHGMVERFNGRISELIAQTRFRSAYELESTLTNYLATYNHRIPQRALGHLSPNQALKMWHSKQPNLFNKRVHQLAGLDR
jgi:transposase InsO family protein